MIHSERRRFTRLKVHHLLKWKVADKEVAEKSLSFIIDISAGGILFYSKEEIPLHTPLGLEINFPGATEPLRVSAQVIRVKSLKKIGGFEIGAEFIDPTQDFRILIDQKILDVYKKTGEKK